MRLIDADALIEKLRNDPLYEIVKSYGVEEFINAAPTCAAWRWKEPWLEPPELWKSYLCYDTNGRVCQRDYVPVRIVARGRNGNIRAFVTNEENADRNGFVASTYNNRSPVHIAEKTGFYLELPDLPDPTGCLKKVEMQLEEITRRRDNLKQFKQIETGELKWLSEEEDEK